MKDWKEQFGEMSQVWGQSQKSLWDGWYKMASAAGNPSGGESRIKQATEDFQGSQAAALRLVNMVGQMWADTFSQMKDGQNWQQTFNDAMQQARQQFSAPTDWMDASQDAGKLWQLYLKQWQIFGQPWIPMLQQTPQLLHQEGSTAIDLSRLFWDTYENTFGTLLDSPGVGLPRELNRKLKEGFISWQKKQQASMEYQSTIADTLVKAIDKFMQQLAAKAQKGAPVHTVRELVDLWTETADNVFVSVFESEKYIAVQWNLLNSNTNFQIHQREITELMLQMNDLPTLSQVDEANRNIYRHGKEIKALKKVVTGKAVAVPTGDTAKLQQTVNELQQIVKQLQQEVAALKSEGEAAKTASRKKTTKTAEAATEGGNN